MPDSIREKLVVDTGNSECTGCAPYLTLDEKTLTLKVTRDYSSREAWRNSPYVYSMRLVKLGPIPF